MMAPSVEHVLLDKSSMNAATMETASLLARNEYRFSIIEDMSRQIRQLKIYLGVSCQHRYSSLAHTTHSLNPPSHTHCRYEYSAYRLQFTQRC